MITRSRTITGDTLPSHIFLVQVTEALRLKDPISDPARQARVCIADFVTRPKVPFRLVLWYLSTVMTCIYPPNSSVKTRENSLDPFLKTREKVWTIYTHCFQTARRNCINNPTDTPSGALFPTPTTHRTLTLTPPEPPAVIVSDHT